MNKKLIAQAVSLAVAGLALATTASASTTMYNSNTVTMANDGATDGWTRLFESNGDFIPTGPESQGNKGIIMPWIGTNTTNPSNPGPLPFGYTGSSHLNWAIKLTSAGDSAQISQADALSRYGFAAEVDTGGGAWSDNGLNGSGAPTGNGPTGWKHQTDIGLIKSDVAQEVHITLATVNSLFSQFGVTVFQGMDTNTGNYGHHGSWNCPGCTPAKPFTADNPFGTTGLLNIKYSNNVNGTTDIWFDAAAGQIYSIYLGGVGFSRWNTGVDDYVMNITTAPIGASVPVPGAVWLFGSALASLVGFGRRKAA